MEVNVAAKERDTLANKLEDAVPKISGSKLWPGPSGCEPHAGKNDAVNCEPMADTCWSMIVRIFRDLPHA